MIPVGLAFKALLLTWDALVLGWVQGRLRFLCLPPHDHLPPFRLLVVTIRIIVFSSCPAVGELVAASGRCGWLMRRKGRYLSRPGVRALVNALLGYTPEASHRLDNI